MFSCPELLNLLEEINNEQKSERRCNISNLDVNEYNGIKLKCGHWFRYEYFKKIKNKKICPYCNNEAKLKYYSCNHIIQSGKRKGDVCNKRTLLESKKCKTHSKQKNVVGNKCVHILISGKRKGKSCNKKCVDKYCKIHLKKYLFI